MPVEIKELVIRAVVVKQKGDTRANVSRAAKAAITPKFDAHQDAIIQECVAEVMRILRRRSER